MKLKLKELNPNPFKNQINDGKLNEEIITKIRSNLKELGLMGSLPVVNRNNKFFLVAGHHRVEALKREFGKDFEINVDIHNYNDDQMLKGMVVENLTQRSDELMEVADNLNAIRSHLQKSSPGELFIKEYTGKGGRGNKEMGSIDHISYWLNKNGEVMSIGKIQEFLKVYDNLDRRLLKKAEKSEGGEKEEGTISIKDAIILSRVDKKDQFKMKDILNETKLNKDEKSKLVTEYINAPEEIKQEVLKGNINITEIQEAIIGKKLEKKEDVKSIFIPNFEGQLKKFEINVVKLEQQVAIFKSIFKSPNFKTSYNRLDSNSKNKLNGSIYDIKKRIQECYEQVEYFIKQME